MERCSGLFEAKLNQIEMNNHQRNYICMFFSSIHKYELAPPQPGGQKVGITFVNTG